MLFKSNAEELIPYAGGFTKDLSASGLYVFCDGADRPVVGNEVTVEVLLPALDADSSPIRLKSAARVLRVSLPHQPSGFAAIAWFGSDELE